MPPPLDIGSLDILMENYFRMFKYCAFIALLTLQGGCATLGSSPDATADEAPSPEGSSGTRDPWESFNRGVFTFNDKLDGWVLKPTAKGYRHVAPEPVERGVSNFFANLGEIANTFNNVLQWKWKKAGNDAGRFVLNTTFGMAGLVDVAKYAGLDRSEGEDFGQTLSYWGIKSGPYLVLPFIGPSTLTDAIATPVDLYTNPITYLAYLDADQTEVVLKSLEIVDTRAGLLDAEELISGDRYNFIREVYFQRREFLVNDGEVVDDFGDDFDDFGDFDEDF